ncbi:MAG TPA: hypothetical protein VGJ77_12100 [Gaiellaceae bacterium]|jgi:hypothetical protein
MNAKLLVTAALAALASAPGALAAGPSVYTDPTGDAKSAPDLARATLTPSADGATIAFDIELASVQDLADDAAIVVSVDADRSPTTGDSGGYDYAVFAFAGGAGIGKWENGELIPLTQHSISPSLDGGHFRFTLTLADIGSPAAFTFDVGSIHGDDVDRLTESSLEFPVVPKVSGWVFPATLLFPKAGKLYAVQGLQLRLDDNSFVKPETVACTLTYRGKPIAPAGGCRYRIPKALKGKKLMLKVTLTYAGAAYSQTLPLTVK